MPLEASFFRGVWGITPSIHSLRASILSRNVILSNDFLRSLMLPRMVGLALLYALLSKASLVYFSGHGAVSIFWPPAGLALAAVLLGGRRCVLSIFLGSWLSNATDPSFSVLGAVGLAGANATEALVGQVLLRKHASFSDRLEHLSDYFRLVALGGFIGAGAGALLGVTALVTMGKIAGGSFGFSMLHWWMGDVLGIVMITPLMLVWRRPPKMSTWTQQGVESVLLFLLAFLVGEIVYFDWFGTTANTVVGHYGMFLIVAWIAVRLGLHGVLLVLLMAGVQGVVGSYQDVGLFASDTVRPQQINFWFFLMLLSTVGISLASHFSEHAKLTRELLRAKHRQDALLNAIPDLLFEIDLEGRYHKIYTDHPELLAARPSELVGAKVRDHLPAAAAQVMEAALQQAHEQGSSTGLQYELPLREGSAWFELSVSRLEANGDWPVPHFIVLARNITARKAAEQDLRIAAIAFESQEGMFVADANRIILRVNQAFTQITGYAADEIVGRVSHLFRSGLHSEEFYAQVWDTVNKTGRWQGEMWSRRKNGELVSIWGTLTAVRDEQQRVTHYVRILIDTTHLKLQEQQRLQKEAQLREALVREVHHRIKNNLQGVTGVLRQFAQRHPEIAMPINQAIGQVQSIAAIHGLQGRTLQGEVVLPDLVRAVAAGVQSLWHIPIVLELAQDVRECLVAQPDAVPLALVLNELLSNSVKHSGDGGDVRVSLRRADQEQPNEQRVRLTIANTLDSTADVPPAVSGAPSSGLELVAALLPPRGAQLQQQIEGQFFISTLELEPPAMAWKS